MRYYATKLKNIKIEQILYFVVVCALNFLFFFYAGNGGTLFEKDSNTYIKWSYLGAKRGYTLYPWFLKTIRFIHNEDTYLSMIPIYQSIVSIVCNCILVEFIRKKYKTGKLLGILMHIFIMAPYAYTLPNAVSSHFVLTEGLSIPLFHLSFFFLLSGILNRKILNFVVSVLTGTLLFLLRPQLVIIPMIYIYIIIFYVLYIYIQNKKRLVAIILSSAVVFLIIGWGTYFKIIEGWSSSQANVQLIEATTGKALCLLNEEDAQFYSGLDRDIFFDLLNDCRKNGRLREDFPQSILDYEELHKIINENVTAHESIIGNRYLSVRGDDGGVDAFATRNLITSTEIIKHKAEYIGIILRLMPSSLVASVFFQPPSIRLLCYIWVGILYFIIFGMNFFLIRKRVNVIYVLPSLVVLIILFANAVLCNVLLYGQQRYVIYCMGLFYVTLLVELIGAYSLRNKSSDKIACLS